MGISIDSLDTIRQLKKGDIIYHPEKNEKYSIWEIGRDFFIVELKDERKFVDLLRFHNLIKDGWQVLDGKE
ncbi:MAG TPA: hypothetical protein VKR32_00060 [Puia sp.]|nr:hypothetical protein [Puia sp.]